MSDLILIQTNSYVGIHPFPRLGANDKVAIWGPGNGGNLSLKNELVQRDKSLGEAFSRLGAAPWPPPPSFKGTPYTAPNGGPNFCGTVQNISLEEAVAFFEEHGYSLQTEGRVIPHAQGPLEEITPQTREVNFGEIWESLSVGTLESGYEKLVRVLAQAGRFQRIEATTALGVAAAWPSGYGVYVVRKARVESVLESILYVGMTGKLARKGQGIVLGGSGFAGRIDRYTPYCFTSEGPFCDHFEFGPRASGDRVLELPAAGRYQHRFPLADIITDCFLLTGVEREVAPSFLEAILLQVYFRQTATLPVGNNAF